MSVQYEKITMADVNAVYGAVGALPEIAPVFHHLIWTEMAGGPYGGVYQTAAEIISNVFERLGADWADFKVTPQEFVETDYTIIMIGNYTGNNRSTGKPLNARVAHIFKKQDGKILFEQFTDTALFLD